MRTKVWLVGAAELIGLGALLCIWGCGVPNASPQQQADHKTYLYVGEAFTPDPSIAPPVGYVAQFRMANDGTLTSIGAAVAAGVLPDFASAVTPTNQNLLIPHEAISQFAVGGDGHITPTAGPTVTGSWITFTPNGNFAIIANRVESTVSSYAVASSGALTLLSTAATGRYPQGVAIDQAGKFAYVANWDDGTISQYTVSAGGVLTNTGSVSSGGYNPRIVAISPRGFLYCGNANSASVTEFAINASTGALGMIHKFASGSGGGPLWISFDPMGRYAYVGGYTEIAEFKVNPINGALTTNGTVASTSFLLWGQLDPSGKFLFATGVNGTVSGFKVNSNGTLTPNGSVFLGDQMVGETLAFALR